MKTHFSLCIVLVLLAAGRARAQSCAPATALVVSNVTASSATLTFALTPAGTTDASYATVSYSYVGGPLILTNFRSSPVQLAGLPPATQVTVQVTRLCINALGAGPATYPAVPVTLTFTTAGPLATRAEAPGRTLTLAPNPAQAGTTLALAVPLARPAPVQVLDALGRTVRQQVLPAQATTAALNVAGLPPGLYLVRCADASARLVVD
ncbi:T9SS type A sorting domain-containing protein [Hymenobacter daeguensis]